MCALQWLEEKVQDALWREFEITVRGVIQVGNVQFDGWYEWLGREQSGRKVGAGPQVKMTIVKS